MKQIEADNSLEMSSKHDGIVNIVYDDPRICGDNLRSVIGFSIPDEMMEDESFVKSVVEKGFQVAVLPNA